MRRDDSGTSLIEFALTAPLMCLLLIGIIEIGRFTFFAILASSAARAGAQYASQNLGTAINSAQIQSAAKQDGQNLPNWIVTATALCSTNGAAPVPCNAAGTAPPQNVVYFVKVQVAGTFTSLLTYPGLPPSVPVSGSAVMRVSAQ
ncbi:MAG: pilus assembly protein [Candidatus Eremiobacteraeota bacterium]|nr:pilus assembly protein [Candidatus Eremiobacteraeota bacterium]